MWKLHVGKEGDSWVRALHWFLPRAVIWHACMAVPSFIWMHAFFQWREKKALSIWRRRRCAACAKMAEGIESNACVGTRGEREREREIQVRNDQTSPCNPSPFPCSSSSAAAAAWRRLRRCHTTVKLLLLQLLTGNCALLECWYKCRATLCMAVCRTLLFQNTPVNLSHFKYTHDFI